PPQRRQRGLGQPRMMPERRRLLLQHVVLQHVEGGVGKAGQAGTHAGHPSAFRRFPCTAKCSRSAPCRSPAPPPPPSASSPCCCGACSPSSPPPAAPCRPSSCSP